MNCISMLIYLEIPLILQRSKELLENKVLG